MSGFSIKLVNLLSWGGACSALRDNSHYCLIFFAISNLLSRSLRRTGDLIPLCHPLPLDQVSIDIRMDDDINTAVIRCECRVTHKTGVEMEALVGASVAALTIYDMTKALSHQIQIQETTLIHKSGGRRTVGVHNSRPSEEEESPR